MIIIKDKVIAKEKYEDNNNEIYEIYTKDLYERFGDTINVKHRQYEEINENDEVYIKIEKKREMNFYKIINGNSEEVLNNEIKTIDDYAKIEGYEHDEIITLTKEKGLRISILL